MATLSVILPNYNDAQTLPDALEALLTQSRKPDEIIFVDDASTDDSVAVACRFAERDASLRVLRNETNSGTTVTLGRGLQEATGDFVYLGASDDRVLPGAFEAALAALEEHPKAGLCCGDMEQFHDDGTPPFIVRFLPGQPAGGFSPDAFREALLRQPYTVIPTNSTLIRRSALIEAGGLRPNLRWLTDWFALYVIAFRHGLCYVPQPFSSVRLSAGSFSATGMGQWRRLGPVLEELLALIHEPEFADIWEGFRIPAVLAPFGCAGLYVLAKHPAYRGLLSPRLLRMAMAHSHARSVMRLKRSLFPRTPRPLVGVYRGVRAACRAIRGRSTGTAGK